MTDTLTIYRDATAFPESNVAVICATEIEAYEAEGWTVETAEKKPRAKKAKGDNTDPLDIPNDDAGGLTLRGLHADIAGLGLDVDPTMGAADLLALRDLHREERAKGGE